MKKGFTLIELLGVIVIIGILALITIPLLTNVINESRKGALRNSGYGLIEAASLYYAQYNPDKLVKFDIVNGVQQTEETMKLAYKGQVKNGTVVINTFGKVLLCINDNNYKAYKNFNDNEVIVEKKAEESDICSVDTNEEGNTELVVSSSSSKKMVYPVGAIYMSVDNTDPSELFGGTWEAFATGKTLIGAGTGTDSSQTAMTFNAGSTGGEYNHAISVSELPSHKHSFQDSLTGSISVTRYPGGNNSGGVYFVHDVSANTNNPVTKQSETDEVGGNQAMSLMQPYVVVYMWRRIS